MFKSLSLMLDFADPEERTLFQALRGLLHLYGDRQYYFIRKMCCHFWLKYDISSTIFTFA
ncbi:hypothetical protein TH4_14250 [Thalassospira tepidiphila MCCC 1A03514]|uniref:Uncharacterized protein n=2 Tax=Thalassospira TaxID=168934 RepID=A0A853KY71_9PROT|nr:hypothetical protein DY252_15070 [Thalassospira indica]KZC99799.1 hypothetical protein AUQ41_09005 [Thalassospira sp. MCCC 1A02898]OAZ09024.1 hypothetical protein TH4_14250 [Thalassospira tepidiphila MCCC 1A03514]OAZ12508.1 hypothetical protein TH15_16195 [Thalassospira profundimaris]ONH86128.1 hypothetical protein TH47_18710 [Thalassospira sp. MCCC 1A02803]